MTANNTINGNRKNLMYEVNKEQGGAWRSYPLNKCKASIYPVDGERISGFVLRSYSTNVAFYSTRTKRVYVFDYYSATTTQHCYKFYRWLKNRGEYVDDIISTYCRSDKRVANGVKWTRHLHDTDYESVVENF